MAYIDSSVILLLLAPVYGITKPITSYNPLVLTFHEWISMFKDVVRDKEWRYLVKSPNWLKQKNNDIGGQE